MRMIQIMSELKTIEFIYGDPFLTQNTINLLQDYFQVDWVFAKHQFIYYLDPESGIPMCKSKCVLTQLSDKYKFKKITIQTIKEYVDRLQKPKTDLNRGDQQTASKIQCASSKITIASGHLEDRTIDFRRRSKAQIDKANLSF